MKKLMFTAFLLLSTYLLAQTSVIEGVVKDNADGNQPLMFATVTVKETQQSMTTGFRGGYFFDNLKPGTYTLVYRFLGYDSITKVIEVKAEKQKVDVLLTPSSNITFEATTLTSK